MADDSNEAEWRNDANWSLYRTIYCSPADTRIVVPKKRIWLGWTLNFARGESWAILAGIGAAAAAATVALSRRRRP
jgi:uncharacterized membrane protein